MWQTDGRTDGRTPRWWQRRAKHSAFARKNGQLDILSAKTMKIWTKCVFCVLFWLSNNTKVVIKNAIFCLFFPQVVQKTASGWGGQLNNHLHQEYSYQNWLQLDHFSSSYDEKILVCFYASQCITWIYILETRIQVSSNKQHKIIGTEYLVSDTNKSVDAILWNVFVQFSLTWFFSNISLILTEFPWHFPIF